MEPKTHRHRDDLIGEHKFGDAGQLIIAILFTLVWVIDSFFLAYTTVLNDYIPLGIRVPIGIGLLIISGYLANRGLTTVFGEERENATVISEGVFGLVRHPVYLSEILLYLGFLFLSISLAAAAVWAVAVVFLHFIARYEEKLLLDHFGDQYRDYMRTVPMWIPRPGRPNGE